MKLNREQIVKDLQEIVENYSGSWKRFNVLDNALSLINELTEENERLKAIPEQLYKEMSERMEEECKIARKYTVRKMQSEIEKQCIEGGIYPAFVASTINKIAKEMLDECKE